MKTNNDEKNSINIATIQTDIGYMKKGLDTIETKIDNVISVKADKVDLNDVKKDVKSLMAWRYYFSGISAAVGAAIALLINYIRGIR